MNSGHANRGRGALIATAVATGLLLTLAGCGSGDGGDAESGKASSPSTTQSKSSQPENEPSQTAQQEVLAETRDGDITVQITSAKRDQGGFVTVSGQVRNGGSGSWMAANWQSDERELEGNGGSLSGASLVDDEGKKRYLILRDTTGRCLCTKFERLRAGDSASWFAQFPSPPEGTTKVDFQVGSMPPAAIEISEGE
ncbi:hypothetical protein [Streptomyces uncialis]|uniref:hypothetical protein n=1 Tax=Streptomyces uncialis TaxID=1048205 RepID=UPI003866D5DD|nr:hypothetical protein OG268_13365 [Streptomyces uncialis]